MSIRLIYARVINLFLQYINYFKSIYYLPPKKKVNMLVNCPNANDAFQKRARQCFYKWRKKKDEINNVISAL